MTNPASQVRQSQFSTLVDSLHRPADHQRHPDQHGRQRRLARQRLNRTRLEKRQIRVGLSEGLRQRAGSPRLHRKVSGLLQRLGATSEPGSADAGSGLLQCAAANPSCGIIKGRIDL